MVTKHSKPNVMIISAKRYEELDALEDKVWTARAQEAEKNGYMTPEESTAFIEGMIDAGS